MEPFDIVVRVFPHLEDGAFALLLGDDRLGFEVVEAALQIFVADLIGHSNPKTPKPRLSERS